jgi:hypothetical protein
MHELLVMKANGSDLIGYFRITKILEFLHEYFYWPNINRNM